MGYLQWHLMEKVKTHNNKQTNTDFCISLVKSADISRKKLKFKAAFKEKYSHWIMLEQKSYTAVDNVCAPDKVQC